MEDTDKRFNALHRRLGEVMCALHQIEAIMNFFLASMLGSAVLYLWDGRGAVSRFGAWVIVVAAAFCLRRLDQVHRFRRDYE